MDVQMQGDITANFLMRLLPIHATTFLSTLQMASSTLGQI
jgi:hypothetical protein